MRSTLVVILLILASYSGFAQKAPEKKYQGLLWEITGNGLTKPSYLYGTMHVSEKLAFHLSDTFFIALRKCDVVALELDPGLWMEQNLAQENAANNREFLYSDRGASGMYKDCFSPNFVKKEQLQRMLSSKPRLINSMLYRSDESQDEFEEDTYLDLFIYQAGKKLGKKVVGLEDFKKSRIMVDRAYIRDDNWDSEEYKELRETMRIKIRQLEKEKSLREYQEDSYRLGDLDMIDSLYRLMNPGVNFIKWMLHERNKIMADQMDSLMKNQTLFTGVGAAHLPGEMGVIEMLRRKGYKVRAVVFSNTQGDKMKTEIEDTKYPVKFSTQTTADKMFSVDLPGPLFKMSERWGNFEYLYNDMANGSYYHIQRVNYMGQLDLKDQNYTLKRIDSLLYENIPGKIISKKEIKSNNGYPGFDISNKTRRGDNQRYQIFVGPLEIYIFKMSGRKEYVAGKEADQFFNSITFRKDIPTATREIQPVHGGFSLQMPGNPTWCFNNNQRMQLQRDFLTSVDENGNYYFFFHTQVNDFSFIEEDTFELNYLCELFAQDIEGKINKREIIFGTDGPELRAELEKKKEGNKYWLRILLHNEHYYMAGTDNKDEISRNAFLESLKWKEYRYNVPFESYTDTTMFFSAKLPVNRMEYADLVNSSDLMERIDHAMEEKEEENIYRPTQIIRVFSNPETGEKIEVEYRKFSMYFQQKDAQKFWEDQEKGFVLNSSMLVNKNKDGYIQNDQERNYLLTDTNSTRGLRIRIIQKCGVLYTLTAQIDTVSGPSKFISEFFSSFTPADTCIGVDLYSDKLSEHFFGKIYSKDTLTQKIAKEAIGYVVGNLQENHAPLLMEMIGNAEFHKLEMSDKKRLIYGLGKLTDKNIIPFYQSLYKKYQDSVSLQMAILEGLSLQKNTKATKVLLSLLEEDLPIPSGSSSVSGAFSVYFDSLELATPLFPEILKYTKYSEYREPVYKLMADMVNEGVMTKKHYSKFKSDILRDATYDLKKYMASTQNSYSYSYSGGYSRKPRKGSDPALGLSESQTKIYDYCILLAPFYKETTVKAYFDKVLRTPKEDLKLMVSVYLKKSNVPVNDTVWTYYAKKEETRSLLYYALDYHNMLQYFPKEHLNQEAIARSLLFGSQKDIEKDTIAFVEKHLVQTGYGGGYLYIFKTRAKDKKVWKLGYVGFMPTDGTSINIYYDVTKKGTSVDDEETQKKEIEAILKKMRTEGRKRATSGGWDYDLFGYDSF